MVGPASNRQPLSKWHFYLILKCMYIQASTIHICLNAKNATKKFPCMVHQLLVLHASKIYWCCKRARLYQQRYHFRHSTSLRQIRGQFLGHKWEKTRSKIYKLNFIFQLATSGQVFIKLSFSNNTSRHYLTGLFLSDIEAVARKAVTIFVWLEVKYRFSIWFERQW